MFDSSTYRHYNYNEYEIAIIALQAGFRPPLLNFRKAFFAERRKNEKVEQMDSRIAVYDACHNHGCRTGCDGSEGR